MRLKRDMKEDSPKERRRAYNLDKIISDVVAKPFSLDDIVDAVSRTLAA